ncbi:hypothetical protein ANCCAN_24170 [Ancylostoma caninum]|uniref:ATP synthase subunit b n=1 Tax=Ancylostoma caninum TaxID=29170 RepID=A0A368FD05_ANCCA|nr:hypothetical protein ANCCAN_24170 [Ancylostoma caninum]
MSLSRILPAGKNARFVVIPLRSTHHTAQAGAAHNVEARPEDLDNPSFFQKISLRFQGIPLKDKIDNWLYGEYQKRMDYFKGLIAEDLKDAVEFRKTSAAETESLKSVKEAFPLIMKENMQLQLEAQYRKNVQSVATELKRRLDFLKETEETKKRFEKEQMLKFITEGVEKQASEKAFKDQYLQNAIQTLKGLSVQV